MAFSNSETVINSILKASFEIEITDFRKSLEPLWKSIDVEHRHCNQNYKIEFWAKVFPCEVKNKTEWLTIRPYTRVYDEEGQAQDYGEFSCTVSVTNSKHYFQFPKSFYEIPYDSAVNCYKYLRRSLILDTEDEFLIKGNLNIFFEFSFDLKSVAPLFHKELFHEDIRKFLYSIPQRYCPQKGNVLVFDFTSQILTLPKFQKSRKNFNVYGIPPETESDDSTHSLEHFCLFDTHPQRFILPLDKRQGSMGIRLLKASPVISRLVKEQKGAVSLNMKSTTFLNILYILERGLFRAYSLHEFFEIYKVSRYYEMTELQQKCAEQMVQNLMLPIEIEQVERFADLNSDETLSTLLDSYRFDYEDLVNIFSCIPQALCIKNNASETRDQNYINTNDSNQTCAVLDFTFQILNLPQFHQLRKRFGVYGFQPAVFSQICELNQNNETSLENVWIFDTRPHRFLLSLDDRQDSWGSRLLRASPVMRQYVDSCLWERLEKRIDICYVSSMAFLNVLHFLKWKTFCVSEFNVFLNIYEFSHDFKMKELQRRSAEKMMLGMKSPNELEEVKRLADLYSDEYLSTLLDFCEREDAYSFKFLSCALQTHCINNNVEARHQSFIDATDFNQTFRVLDFTLKILTLPQFHESRKRFGVYGIQPTLFPHNSESNEDSRDNLEHVWIFDTKTARFLLPLDEQQNSVGTRLLEASPVIERMVISPMKEGLEKHVVFPNLSSRTFLNILRYLKEKKFDSSEFSNFLDIYEMAHMYQMSEILEKCAEKMIETFIFPTEFRELERVASLYSDRYLSTMLDSIRRDFADLTIFLSSIPQAHCIQYNVETEDPNDIFTESSRKTLTVFDFSFQILTLPLFHEARERFGVDGIPSVPSSFNSESKECSSDILKDVWMIDTQTDRFLLSFDERQNGVGVQFLKASLIVRIMVEKDMKEKRDKYTNFKHIKSHTFISTLYFLQNKKIPTTKFCEIFDIYNMSHMYSMEELQQECVKKMVQALELRPDYEELKEIADFYSDEYLLNLLDSCRDTFENMEQLELRPDFDFYT